MKHECHVNLDTVTNFSSLAKVNLNGPKHFERHFKTASWACGKQTKLLGSSKSILDKKSNYDLSDTRFWQFWILVWNASFQKHFQTCNFSRFKWLWITEENDNKKSCFVKLISYWVQLFEKCAFKMLEFDFSQKWFLRVSTNLLLFQNLYKLFSSFFLHLGTFWFTFTKF